MDTPFARLIQPTRLATITLVAALIVLLLGLVLSAVLGGSHDLEPLVGPFRWQPAGASIA